MDFLLNPSDFRPAYKTRGYYNKLETAFLVYCGSAVSHSEAATVLGRSRHSVKKWRHDRKIKCSNSRLYAPITPSEASFILKNAKFMTKASIARQIGRSAKSVEKFLYRRRPAGRRIAATSFASIRPLVLGRDGNMCVYCGYDRIVQVHHIDGDRLNNDMSNLVSLCPNHHAEAHAGLLSVSTPELVGGGRNSGTRR